MFGGKIAPQCLCLCHLSWGSQRRPCLSASISLHLLQTFQTKMEGHVLSVNYVRQVLSKQGSEQGIHGYYDVVTHFVHPIMP